MKVADGFGFAGEFDTHPRQLSDSHKIDKKVEKKGDSSLLSGVHDKHSKI